jgi:hypothetical protein
VSANGGPKGNSDAAALDRRFELARQASAAIEAGPKGRRESALPERPSTPMPPTAAAPAAHASAPEPPAEAAASAAVTERPDTPAAPAAARARVAEPAAQQAARKASSLAPGVLPAEHGGRKGSGMPGQSAAGGEAVAELQARYET